MQTKIMVSPKMQPVHKVLFLHFLMCLKHEVNFKKLRPTIQTQLSLSKARDKILNPDLNKIFAYPHKIRAFLSSHIRNSAANENMMISHYLKSPAQSIKIKTDQT